MTAGVTENAIRVAIALACPDADLLHTIVLALKVTRPSPGGSATAAPGSVLYQMSQ